MGTCKTCRWWRGDDKNTWLYANVKRCDSPKILFASETVRRGDERLLAAGGAMDADPHHVLESDEAGIMDGSGYIASMHTGPDFGCIHHETA